MWGKHRPFGVDKKALKQELARREVAHQARLNRVSRAIDRMQAELNRLRADESELIQLQRRLHSGDCEIPPAAAQEEQNILSAEIASHIIALQRIQGELFHLRSLKARIVDQVRSALMPCLELPAPETRPVKEAAHV